jgi:SAM-dependent methyltransferase
LTAVAAERTVRATSFGTVADAYDRFRPGPPREAADWLLPPDVRRVADVCAGTGGFSRVLAPRVDDLVAVELDLRMARMLAARSYGVPVINGRAEVLPIRPASLDAVLISSAWHWLDPDVAVPEMARVLRPGGVLGVVWGGPNRRIGWVRELLGLGRDVAADQGRPGRELKIPDGQPFTEPESRVIEWTLPRSPSELAGLAGTYSRIITLPAAERQSITRQAAAVVEEHPLLRDRSRVDLPMTARCWKAVRLDAGR